MQDYLGILNRKHYIQLSLCLTLMSIVFEMLALSGLPWGGKMGMTCNGSAFFFIKFKKKSFVIKEIKKNHEKTLKNSNLMKLKFGLLSFLLI